MDEQAALQPDMHLFPGAIAFDNNALAGLELSEVWNLRLMNEALNTTQARRISL